MQIWRPGDANPIEPPGHYGHLTTANIVTNDDTRQAFSVQLSTAPPGAGGEMHSHQADSQLFYVLSGELSFDTGDQQFTLHAGEAVLFLPGEQHATHNNGSQESRSLVITGVVR